MRSKAAQVVGSDTRDNAGSNRSSRTPAVTHFKVETGGTTRSIDDSSCRSIHNASASSPRRDCCCH